MTPHSVPEEATPPRHLNPLGPTAPNERIELLDTLRGIAVLGILLINIETLSGIYWLPQRVVPGSPTPGLDRLTLNLIEFLAATKFVTLFSVLFGAGFAMQFARAQRRLTSPNHFLARRMGWLMVFGLLHGFLFFPSGDILFWYALIGLLMIGMMRLGLRTMVVLGGTLATFATAAVFIFTEAVRLPTIDFGLPQGAFVELMFSVYRHGSLLEILVMNVIVDFNSMITGGPLTFVSCWGKFLLGVWLYRVGLFSQPERHEALIRRGILYGLLFGLPSSAAYVLILRGVLPLSASLLWLPFAMSVGLLLHGFLYIGIVVRYRNTRPMRVVAWIVRPLGRMALTNYISQSVICALLFFNLLPGAGLFGQLGHALLMTVVFAIFTLQIIASHVWLRALPYGPLEWLWRRLSYGDGGARWNLHGEGHS